MSEIKNNDKADANELILDLENTEDFEISLSDDELLLSEVTEPKPEATRVSEEVANDLNISFSLNEVVETAENNVISSPKPKGKGKPALGSVNSGAIGASFIEVKEELKKTTKLTDKPVAEKVAIFSTKNVTWNEVGKVYRGYNIVTKEQADKWLTRDHARVATPEEVAKEFGVN
jgi:hypothetical protein